MANFILPSYGTKTDLTITLASLATNATFVVGRQSTQVTNATNRFDDAILDGFISVGTTPTINTRILVMVWGANDDLSTQALDGLTGTDLGATITSAGIMYGIMRQAVALQVDATTSDRKYNFQGVSVKNALGLSVLPKFWGVYVSHNTGVNLNATGGNHKISYLGVKREIVAA
jgi:hypothetical protein